MTQPGVRVHDDDLAEFVRARYLPLLRRAVLLTGDRGRAEDLVQEALARLWSASHRTDVIDREAYVRQTMVRLSISWWRRAKSRPVESPTDQLPGDMPGVLSDSVAEPREVDEPVWLALSALPPRQRAVMVLRFYEELTEAEICAVLGISPGTVRSQSFKARRRLRELLDPMREEVDR